MKSIIQEILNKRNLGGKYNLDLLYGVGMQNIINNIEYYYDKPYTCESVIKELFMRGIIDFIDKKTQVN